MLLLMHTLRLDSCCSQVMNHCTSSESTVNSLQDIFRIPSALLALVARMSRELTWRHLLRPWQRASCDPLVAWAQICDALCY
jgi:hypothetical protein